MTNKHNFKKPQNKSENSSNRKWKVGIVLLWLWILTISAVWYSYYNNRSKASYLWSKWSYTNTSQWWGCNMGNSNSKVQWWGCSMMKNTSNTSSQWWGCPMMRNKTTTQNKTIQTTTIDTQAQQIQMTYDESWLQPSIVNAQVGKSYKISIKLNKDIYGCMNTITLPWLDENIQNIVKWNTITFNIKPTKAWEYEFLCAMWLSHGAKVIVK